MHVVVAMVYFNPNNCSLLDVSCFSCFHYCKLLYLPGVFVDMLTCHLFPCRSMTGPQTLVQQPCALLRLSRTHVAMYAGLRWKASQRENSCILHLSLNKILETKSQQAVMSPSAKSGVGLGLRYGKDKSVFTRCGEWHVLSSHSFWQSSDSQICRHHRLPRTWCGGR